MPIVAPVPSPPPPSSAPSDTPSVLLLVALAVGLPLLRLAVGPVVLMKSGWSFVASPPRAQADSKSAEPQSGAGSLLAITRASVTDTSGAAAYGVDSPGSASTS